MKKSVILIISAIYVIAVILVGLMGRSIAGVDEKVFVDYITVRDPDNGALLKTYDPKEKGVKEDYYFVAREVFDKDPITVRIQAEVYPANCSWKDVTFKYDTNQSDYTLVKEEGNIAVITFYSNATALIFPTSTDGTKKEKSVRILCK